jgi:hypothetical protein
MIEPPMPRIAGEAEFHRAGRDLDRLGAAFDGFAIGLGGVADAPAHAARRRAVLGGEIGRGRFGFVIGDQVDPALAPQLDVLRAVARDEREAHRFEHGFENALLRRRKFDELEAVEAQRIFEEVGHDRNPI